MSAKDLHDELDVSWRKIAITLIDWVLSVAA
jgi:hypothetical protein